MADIRSLPSSLLSSLIRPLVRGGFSLAAIKEARVQLGITNPLREIERVVRAIKAQVGKEPALRAARANRIIDPALFAPPLGNLSKKFLYQVAIDVRDPLTGEVNTRTVSVLSSRRLRKDTALRQAVERITTIRPGRTTDIVEDEDIVGAELEAVLDRDL